MYSLLFAEAAAKITFVTMALVAQGSEWSVLLAPKYDSEKPPLAELVGLDENTTACNQDGIAALYVYGLDW